MIQKIKGLFFEDHEIEIFFGNKEFTLSELSLLKPTGVHAVKQTHSDIFHVIDRDEPIHPQPEGDALGTQVRKQHLVIKTADCLPVLIYDPSLRRIAAVHAGWKGVAIKIVPKVIGQYFNQAQSLRLYIGPHIMKSSFEIRNDVLDQLKTSLPASFHSQMQIESKDDKYHVDLVEIVKLQIKSQFPNIQIQVVNSGVDTKTNTDFYSHRREPTNKGRNISYIRLK